MSRYIHSKCGIAVVGRLMDGGVNTAAEIVSGDRREAWVSVSKVSVKDFPP